MLNDRALTHQIRCGWDACDGPILRGPVLHGGVDDELVPHPLRRLEGAPTRHHHHPGVPIVLQLGCHPRQVICACMALLSGPLQERSDQADWVPQIGSVAMKWSECAQEAWLTRSLLQDLMRWHWSADQQTGYRGRLSCHVPSACDHCRGAVCGVLRTWPSGSWSHDAVLLGHTITNASNAFWPPTPAAHTDARPSPCDEGCHLVHAVLARS